jgi:uncharacterized protein YvpB
MLQTYKAILRGNKLEWAGEIPEQLQRERPVEVHVTILHDVTLATAVSPGKRMAEILEKLASINAASEIADPVVWQREIREG